TYHNYTGDGAINGQLNTIHALHIDTTKKFVYLFGSNLFNGGAVILDINSDPYNPTYVGNYMNAAYNYVHDGYVDNDTLYAGHIYQGVFSVADLTNKSAPVVLATQQTPTAFTHNTWLSNDHKYVFTTDENADSYLTAYDISNLANITEVDKIRCTPGSGSIVHNTHILNNWAITSWYRDGITITDVTRPWNLIQVGRYDSYTGSGNGFDGAWGVYPFLPSGTIVVSNIDEGLFVLNPTYVRACYLEGNVADSVCGTTLNNVMVTISTVNVTDSTNAGGDYATGTAIPGTYNVTFSKPGYNSKTYTNVNFAAGIVTNLNVQLFSPTAVLMTGSVTDAITLSGLPSVPVSFTGSNNYSFTTDGAGNISTCSLVGGTYTVTTAAWGYETVCNVQTINSGSPNVNIALAKEYYDDFSLNLGWTVSSTASTGFWVRGNPNGTTNMSVQANPGVDVSTDCGNIAYVTGNGGGTASQDDIDGGATTLTSPIFDLSTYGDAWIHYDRWFYNGGGSGSPNDSLRVFLTNGTLTVPVETVIATSPNNSTWVHSARKVSTYLTPTATMRLIVRAVDAAPGHLVEGGLDRFLVVDSLSTSSVHENVLSESTLNVFPNPFSQSVQMSWNIAKETSSDAYILLTDVSGRTVKNIPVKTKEGSVVFNDEIAEGIYFARLVQDSKVSKLVKIVKVR
ncbi:MAG: choice-of-anchor B family protein, partial [Bacteroidia bacterium]|nr:choice-of-anchor B family protein [Bacteroidia bacterium]